MRCTTFLPDTQDSEICSISFEKSLGTTLGDRRK